MEKIQHPSSLKIENFTYHLPEGKIAFQPAETRAASKLLIYKNGEITTTGYNRIADQIPDSSLMVFNNTKVIAARLLFKKETGGQVEIFCLEPAGEDMATAMQQTAETEWQCMVGGAAKWKNGQVLTMRQIINGQEIILNAALKNKPDGQYLVAFYWDNNRITFAEILHHFGKMPLPPYIKREADTTDADRYQTVYAKAEGSVAAPTAGLHFTPEILQTLQQKNIDTQYVTLHVGAGTFKPVKAETMAGHAMHGEYFEVPLTLIQKLQQQKGQIIAVGTTSLRTLESLYWLGCKLLHGGSHFKENIEIGQWEPYENEQAETSAGAALQAIIDYLVKNNADKIQGSTHIIIAPGYEFKLVTGLVTNFHQPASTLLLLVAAFIGEDWRNVYDYALAHNYRFLSYGDGSLLWRNQ